MGCWMLLGSSLIVGGRPGRGFEVNFVDGEGGVGCGFY